MSEQPNNIVVVFCQAYPYVEACFKIFSKYEKDRKILVVNTDENLFNFWSFILDYKLVHNLDIIYLNTAIDLRPRKIFSLIKERIKLKNLYDLYFKQLKNATIYYFDDLYDVITLSLIKRISKYNNTFYCVNNRWAAGDKCYPPNIKHFTYLMEFIFIGNVLLGYNKSGDNYKIRAGLNFIRKNKIKEVDYIVSFNNDIFKDKIVKIFSDNSNYQKIKVFIFTEYEVKSCKISVQKYNDFVNSINLLLKKYFTIDDIAIKHHPQFSEKEGTNEFYGKIFTRFIPAEFIDLSNKIVLGLSSYSLISSARNEKVKKVISLANLVEYNNLDYKKYIINLLTNEDKSIFIADNIMDLEKLLAENKTH